MTTKPTFNPNDQEVGSGLVKARNEYPTWDFVKGLKSAKQVKDKKGGIKYKISDRNDLLALHDATRKAMSMETDVYQQEHSKTPKVRVRLKDMVREIPESEEEKVLTSGKGFEKISRIKPTSIYRQGRWWVKKEGSWVPEDDDVA